MKEVLKIEVVLTGGEEVKGTTGEAAMVFFEGKVDCELFHGEIMPGGSDTQKQWKGESKTLSARYILKGTDIDGVPCKLFVENNGTVAPDGSLVTKPRIITDSKALAFLETAELEGTVSSWEKGVIIRIFMV